MASGILLVIVVAVIGAILAGQQNAFEAHQRIAGTLAAEELMSRIVLEDYDGLASFDGFDEAIGEMTTTAGTAYPRTYDMVGRMVEIEDVTRTVTAPPMKIRGRQVWVRSVTADRRVLAEVGRFVPEPAVRTVAAP